MASPIGRLRDNRLALFAGNFAALKVELVQVNITEVCPLA